MTVEVAKGWRITAAFGGVTGTSQLPSPIPELFHDILRCLYYVTRYFRRLLIFDGGSGHVISKDRAIFTVRFKIVVSAGGRSGAGAEVVNVALLAPSVLLLRSTPEARTLRALASLPALRVQIAQVELRMLR